MKQNTEQLKKIEEIELTLNDYKNGEIPLDRAVVEIEHIIEKLTKTTPSIDEIKREPILTEIFNRLESFVEVRSHYKNNIAEYLPDIEKNFYTEVGFNMALGELNVFISELKETYLTQSKEGGE